MSTSSVVMMKHSEKSSRKNFGALWLVVTWMAISMIWWGLAFWPVSQVSPQWLARTQFVCFGSRPNGLPDTFGWMLLFGGPASLLVTMIFTYGTELRREITSVLSHRTERWLLLFLLGAFSLELGWMTTRVIQIKQAESAGFVDAAIDAVDVHLPESYPRLFEQAPDFNLINEKGESVSLNDFKGTPLILTFAFAHCPSVCPLLIENTKNALLQMNPQSVRAVFITLDPWRDTPTSLPSLAKKWGLPANASILSGPVKDVTNTLKSFNVIWQRDENTGEVVHPTLTYVIDRENRMAYSFQNASSQWLVDAIQRLN